MYTINLSGINHYNAIISFLRIMKNKSSQEFNKEVHHP
jgi:hypothetical protein